jgi:hypothetical protein
MSLAETGFNTNRPALSRRAFLTATGSTLAGTALVAAPLALADTAELHPDAELLHLGREWEAAAALCGAHSAVINAACDRYDVMRPKHPPEGIFYRDSDYGLAMPAPKGRLDGRWWYGGQADDLRARSIHDPKVRARVTEIVAAFDEWRDGIRKAREASGLAAAEAEDMRLSKIETVPRKRIFETPARTMEGIMLKAHVATWCWGGIEELERDLAKADGPHNEAFACLVVRELMALNQRAS